MPRHSYGWFMPYKSLLVYCPNQAFRHPQWSFFAIQCGFTGLEVTRDSLNRDQYLSYLTLIVHKIKAPMTPALEISFAHEFKEQTLAA
ncbi:hypothetical protein M5689_010228 [Euphorbia peplus]|nr:hypothetical protein M5689_010228 [Euphorbia peplus]